MSVPHLTSARHRFTAGSDSDSAEFERPAQTEPEMRRAPHRQGKSWFGCCIKTALIATYAGVMTYFYTKESVEREPPDLSGYKFTQLTEGCRLHLLEDIPEPTTLEAVTSAASSMLEMLGDRCELGLFSVFDGDRVSLVFVEGKDFVRQTLQIAADGSLDMMAKISGPLSSGLAARLL